MIHVFTCCDEVFKLPAKACKACGAACESCGEICEPCQGCCDEMSSICSDFVHRPLGLYVALAVLASATEIGFCVAALLQESFELCVLPQGLASKVGMGHWIKVQMGSAWLNLIFAPYIQYQLMQKLQERAEISGSEVEVEQESVKDAFKEVFLYDVGVCLYVFAAIASCAWSILGLTWLPNASQHCNPKGYVSVAAYLGAGFFWGLVVYAIVWYCYISCTESIPVGWAIDYMQVPAPAPAALPPPTGAFSKAKGVLTAVAGAAAGRLGGHVQAAAAPAPVPAPPPPKRGCKKACSPTQLAKLVACIGLDVFGSATYFMPALGEGIDVAYAPVEGIALKMLFKSNSFAILGFTEEILPFTDVIPTALMAWTVDTFFADTSCGKLFGFKS